MTITEKSVLNLNIPHPYICLLYDKILQKGFKVYNCYDFFSLMSVWNRFGVLHLHWIEQYLINYNNKNIIYSVFKSSGFILFLIMVRYLCNKPIITTLHNVYPHRQIHPKLEYYGFIVCLILSSRIIVHNNYSKAKAIEVYSVDENKIRIIPCGSFNSCYPNDISKLDARSILNIPNDKFVILFFGAISRYKGIYNLLSIMDEILKEDNDIYIIISGICPDDDVKRDLIEFNQKHISNSLIKIQYIPDKDVQIYMNASDVGIIPYIAMSTSGSLLLFMYFKRAVIMPDLEQLKEVAREYGIYYNSNQIQDLKKTIIQAKNGYYDLEYLSNRLYELTSEYQWDDIAERTIEVYESGSK
jgi:beta-1,4-mannosyltransferase